MSRKSNTKGTELVSLSSDYDTAQWQIQEAGKFFKARSRAKKAIAALATTAAITTIAGIAKGENPVEIGLLDSLAAGAIVTVGRPTAQEYASRMTEIQNPSGANPPDSPDARRLPSVVTLPAPQARIEPHRL